MIRALRIALANWIMPKRKPFNLDGNLDKSIAIMQEIIAASKAGAVDQMHRLDRG